jgi:hypothetical protein
MKSPLSDFVSFQIQRGDFIYLVVLFLCIFAFVALESIWLLRQLREPGKKQKQLLWSFIPALVLFGLTLVYKSS